MQRWPDCESEEVNAMNRLLVSSCFSVVLTLSAADAGWSQATANPTVGFP
jgi:hypothetical protein